MDASKVITHTAISYEADARNVFREDFDSGCRFATLAGITGYRSYQYDTGTLPLRDHLERLLVDKGLVTKSGLKEAGGLEFLHKILPKEVTDLDKDEVNQVTRQFYDQDDAFLGTYRSFIKAFCETVIGEDCLFQRNPTIRFHFPNPRGFDWRPRFHNDIMLGHPPQECNLWIPLTRAYGTNSMLILPLKASVDILREANLGMGEFPVRVQTDEGLQKKIWAHAQTVDLSYGQYTIFDSRCLHATNLNTTEHTRVSVDLRVVPISDFEKMRMQYRGTGRLKMPFDRGHYYDTRSAAEI